MKVKNKRCIRNLGFKQFKAAKARNLIAIFAIALTTLLFTSLFTVALSMNSSYEEYTFRQIGGFSHGTFKEVDEEKIEALANHSKVKEYGLRTTMGFISEAPFSKIPAEISWMDANTTNWSYATPTTGRMPESGNEISMDTESLRKLGVPAKLGEQVELTYAVRGKDASIETSEKKTDTFTLVGFWEYDALMPVHYINISEEYMRQVEDEFVALSGDSFQTDMNVMLASSLNIRGVMEAVDEDLGYQWEDRYAENCVRIGTNWGYSSTKLDSMVDPTTIVAIVAFILLVVFTGYLIIYNIFQISVSNDIRFYGMLKTIGTTPKQLKRIVRLQAFYLSVIGIPIGCALGYAVGAVLTPKILSTSLVSTVKLSSSPLIFLGAALFALLTVWLSSARPGKKAASITPVEAVRYTENWVGNKKKRTTKGAKINQMAFANLGRNRVKTALVIVSLSLAVVLLNCVFMFKNGFDMEKYVSTFSATDFMVSTPNYFRYQGVETNSAITDASIAEIQKNTNASLEGSTYIISDNLIQGWLNEAEFRSILGPISDDTWQQISKGTMKREDLFAAEMLLEGMDEALLEKLQVYEGSLQPLTDPEQHAIALGVYEDDNGELYCDAKKVGDTLTLTYVEEGHYYDSRTGELCTEDTPDEYIEFRVVKGHDVTYTVCALVGVPYKMSHRYSGMTSFPGIITSAALKKDSGLEVTKMYYCFDTPDEAAEVEAEKFLAEYTVGENSELMYESKALLRAEFYNFQKMFLLVGGSLCIIVGLVGILNFFNAILTGILTRHREFAMLQSVGMTGKQLKQMLVYEGIFYAAGAGILSIVLSLIIDPLVGGLLEGVFWFCTYQFTILPVLVIIPIFIILGVILPLIIYRFTSKKSIVERLRETE